MYVLAGIILIFIHHRGYSRAYRSRVAPATASVFEAAQKSLCQRQLFDNSQLPKQLLTVEIESPQKSKRKGKKKRTADT